MTTRTTWFLDALASEIGRPPGSIQLHSRLIEDLDLDSLGRVALLLWIEDLASAYAPDVDELPGPDVAAVFGLYRRLAAAPSAPPTATPR